MLYTITPEQEKAALKNMLRYEPEYQSLISQDFLLSDINKSNDLNQNEKSQVIIKTLQHLYVDIFLENNTSYTSLKNHFAKYENTSLLGTIDGVSLTGEDFNQLINPSPDYETLDNAELIIHSLPFSFIKQASDIDSLFNEYVMNSGSSYNYTVLPQFLLFCHYKLNETQLRELIKTHSQEYDAIPFLSAYPQTKDMLVRTDFINAYNSIKNNNLKYFESYTQDLKEAYYDLFHEELPMNTEALYDL